MTRLTTSIGGLALILAGICSRTHAQPGNYIHFIRQIQYPSGVQMDLLVQAAGETMAPLPIEGATSKFELWSVNTTSNTVYLLDSTVVSAYLPVATLAIRSEDPYSVIPRTRADRPFQVVLSVAGLLSGAEDPASSKSVSLHRHVQSYGPAGDGNGLDRTQATLLSQESITTNGAQTLSYTVTSVPGADQSKVRGEERFSVFSPAGYDAPSLQIDSKTIQIWPVADGSITGITQGQTLGASAPQVTFTLHDLYPSSRTYAQVYRGSPQLGTAGTVVPGTSLVINTYAPSDRTLTVANYDSIFDSDGLWTMELQTQTPFGTERLAVVSFTVQGHDSFQSQLMVTGNGAIITDGDTTPAVEDTTDFGYPATDGGTVVRTFAIQNTGDYPLTLSGTPQVAVNGLHASDFTVTRQPASQLAVGESSTFEITYASSGALFSNAALSIEIGAPVGNTFDFAVQGGGITRESWRQIHFGTIDNSGDGADLNDFDHDGIVNLIEFAFGLDPKDHSAGLLPAPQQDGSNQVIRFTQPSGVAGVIYGAEWSTSLRPDSWNTVVDSAVPPMHSFSVPLDSKPNLYLRLKVTSP